MPPRFRKPAPRPGKTVRNGRKTAGKNPQVDINIPRSRYEPYRFWAGSQSVAVMVRQVIRAIGAEGLDRRGPAGSCRLFLGPGFRLAARWNRLVETVKTRKKRGKTGEKWARYGLKRVKEGS